MGYMTMPQITEEACREAEIYRQAGIVSHCSSCICSACEGADRSRKPPLRTG